MDVLCDTDSRLLSIYSRYGYCSADKQVKVQRQVVEGQVVEGQVVEGQVVEELGGDKKVTNNRGGE